MVLIPPPRRGQLTSHGRCFAVVVPGHHDAALPPHLGERACAAVLELRCVQLRTRRLHQLRRVPQPEQQPALEFALDAALRPHRGGHGLPAAVPAGGKARRARDHPLGHAEHLARPLHEQPVPDRVRDAREQAHHHLQRSLAGVAPVVVRSTCRCTNSTAS